MAVKQSDVDALMRDMEGMRRDFAVQQAILADAIDLIAGMKKRLQQLETNEQRKAGSTIVDVRRYASLQREGEHPGRSLGIGSHGDGR